MGKTNRKVSRRNRSARLPCLEDSAKVCLQQGAGHRRGEGHEQTGRSLPLQGLPPEATDQDRYTATKIIRTFVLYMDERNNQIMHYCMHAECMNELCND